MMVSSLFTDLSDITTLFCVVVYDFSLTISYNNNGRIGLYIIMNFNNLSRFKATFGSARGSLVRPVLLSQPLLLSLSFDY